MRIAHCARDESMDDSTFVRVHAAHATRGETRDLDLQSKTFIYYIYSYIPHALCGRAASGGLPRAAVCVSPCGLDLHRRARGTANRRGARDLLTRRAPARHAIERLLEALGKLLLLRSRATEVEAARAIAPLGWPAARVGCSYACR